MQAQYSNWDTLPETTRDYLQTRISEECHRQIVEDWRRVAREEEAATAAAAAKTAAAEEEQDPFSSSNNDKFQFSASGATATLRTTKSAQSTFPSSSSTLWNRARAAVSNVRKAVGRAATAADFSGKNAFGARQTLRPGPIIVP